jgi:hypothetical protein
MAYHGEVDPEIKARALTLARAVGAYQAAKQCGLVFTTVQRWVREDDAAAAGIPKPPPKPRGRKSRASAMVDAATVPPSPPPVPVVPPRIVITPEVQAAADIEIQEILESRRPMDKWRRSVEGQALLGEAAAALLRRITRDADNMPIDTARKCFETVSDVILASTALRMSQPSLVIPALGETVTDVQGSSQSDGLAAEGGADHAERAGGDGHDEVDPGASADDLALDPPALG